MRRLLLETISVIILATGICRGAMVTERWGVGGRAEHPNALKYESLGDEGTLMQFDLSALPEGVKVYRARLLLTRPEPYGSRFEIVPIQRNVDGEWAVLAQFKPLGLVPPWFQWFDATETVRRWVQGGRPAGLLLRQAPGFAREAAYLEIAYEGQLKSPPKQVRGIKAFYRAGQVFIRFQEIEDFAGGKEEITWRELARRFRDISSTGPIPRDDPREIRYRVYTHQRPITAASIGEAELLAEVVPGSIYNTRLVPGGDFIKMREGAVALRLAVEPGKPLAPGMGLYVHTVRRNGRRYYAVVSAVNGVENTLQLSAENTAGPIDGRRATIEPVRQQIPKAHGHNNAGVSELRDGMTYHEDWYSYWATPPWAPRPLRYDFAVGYCPATMTQPAPLTFTRGHTWGPNPEMPGPEPRPGIVMSMSTDPPNGFWTGINDARNTLKGIEQGSWQPFTHNRQETLIRWARQKWPIDAQRICSAIGAWGMWEIKRADLYAYIHGWGMPEVTKGFQCWNWARGAWGPPEAYRDKPNDQNPFYLQDYTRWILDNPTKELPYFYIHTGWGAHFSEMGWPPFPRFVRAMIDTKRAFTMYCGGGPVGGAIRDGLIVLRRDQSLPAWGNCSLDDNLGEGDIRSGKTFGQVNGYLLWETESLVEEPNRWEITVWLDESAPLPECTVDLTPRRCRRFKARQGQPLRWTNTLAEDDRQVAAGRAVADAWGLVTIPKLRVTKAKHRVVIVRQ